MKAFIRIVLLTGFISFLPAIQNARAQTPIGGGGPNTTILGGGGGSVQAPGNGTISASGTFECTPGCTVTGTIKAVGPSGVVPANMVFTKLGINPITGLQMYTWTATITGLASGTYRVSDIVTASKNGQHADFEDDLGEAVVE